MGNKTVSLAAIVVVATATTAGGAVKRAWSGAVAEGAGSARAGTLGGGLSDVIQDVYVDGGRLLVATLGGLGVTDDGGTSWRTFHKADGLPSDDILAVAGRGGDIWASCMEVVEDPLYGEVYWGRGLARYDAGAGRWRVYGKAQGLPADGRQELIWDIVIDDAGVVWVALWNGGIGKSADNGESWELITPKDNFGDDCTHFLSLTKRGDLIWAAAELNSSNVNNILSGVFKSEDNGSSWTYYPVQHGVAALCAVVDLQPWRARDVVWVGTAPAFPGDPQNEGHGVFRSDDGGQTWENFTIAEGLSKNNVYGLASAGPWEWVGTTAGVSRTDDGGASWKWSGIWEGLPDQSVLGMAAASETDVWAGTEGGLGFSDDSGATWRKVEITPRGAPLDLPRAFAFPNPFAPSRDGVLTFRYALAEGGNVTLDIYDFAGRRVARLVDNEYRGPADRVDELWRGERDDGGAAANGVYFFTIKLDGAAAARGKFVILE